jgi:flagellar hook-length control protein FliK
VPQAATAQPGTDGGSEDVEAAGAQQAAAPNPDGAKPKTAGDAKKALDDAKPASSKTAPKVVGDTAPAPNAAQPHADAHADTNGDSGQAGARPADAAAQPPAPTPLQANAAPQPDVLSVAVAAPHSGAAQTTAPMPAAHHAPNMPTPNMPMPNMPAPNMNGLAVDIAAKSLGGAKQFDIRLDPPELGRVEVRLSIDATGKASAHLSADQPQTLDLLQKDAASLTRALRDAGLNVAQDGLNFSLRSQQQQTGGGRQHQPSGGRAFRGTIAVPATLQPVAAATNSGRGGRSLLDIKV